MNPEPTEEQVQAALGYADEEERLCEPKGFIWKRMTKEIQTILWLAKALRQARERVKELEDHLWQAHIQRREPK